MTTPTRRLVPVEATGKMFEAGAKVMRRIQRSADSVFARMVEASPNAGKVTRVELRGLAAAIKKASSERRYGKYDYSKYPGEEPPFVIRDEKTGDIVFRSRDYDEAEREYVRLCDEHLARAALASLCLEVEGE